MRILTGLQPTGKLHIGNYLGSIKPMVDYLQEGELFCFVANMHSLTSIKDKKVMQDNTMDAFIDLVALGIDPKKSILWIQSDVPEVAELTWYLNCVTPFGLLERCHSYKDKVSKNIPASSGLFIYPVLMAADILLYDSNIIPVGRDQKQHVEVTRDIAIKFNHMYGDVFVVPKPQIKEDLAVIPGIDGQKMSKSYNNTIEIFETEKKLRKKIMGIVTDSIPVEEPKDPDSSYIYQLYRLFATPEESEAFATRFRAGGMGYGDAKKTLLGILIDTFANHRKKREELVANLDYINEIRKEGAEKARDVAAGVLDRVRNAVGVI